MIVIYILLGIAAVLVLLAIIAPKRYELKRSVVINRPVSDVFTYVKMVKNQDYWSPWKKRDPNMKQSFIGTDGTVGFVSMWDSEHKQVGAGEQEIKKVVNNERIDTELRFLKPWKSVSDAYLITNNVDGSKAEVIWGFKGVNKVPFNIMMLFYNMDKAVGKDFDEGLSSLKEILEA